MSAAKPMIKLGLVLAVYAFVSCTVLAVVNNFTAPRIELNQIKKRNMMMQKMIPEADSFEKVENFEPSGNRSITIDSLYSAVKDGEVIGAIVQVSGPTYDKATIVLAIDRSLTVKGMDFLELTDSPGFGNKAMKSDFFLPSGKTFYGQFAGLDSSKGFTAGETFDAISGATITSKGVGELLNAGTKSITAYLKELGNE
jgi:electron transport complex protein RnfG